MFDVKLFEYINNLAGRYAWLDILGRSVAVYGLLAVLLLAAAVVWWPRWDSVVRQRYLLCLLLIAAGCALLAGLEWAVTTHILHHDLRTRPANARWATLLITADSAMSFPAWPAVLVFALVSPTLRIARRIGLAMAVLGAVLGLSLVFVGVNYPVDVLIGSLLGITMGQTGVAMSMLPPQQPRAQTWRTVGILWATLIIGTAAVAFRLYASSSVHAEKTTTPTVSSSTVRVTPATNIMAALNQAAKPNSLTLQAATNGHLLVADARVLLAHASPTRPEVEAIAHQVTNAAFANWHELQLLTVTITAASDHGAGVKTGTFYTVTITRTEWPAGGIPLTTPLPGKKFYHPSLLRPANHQQAIAPGVVRVTVN